MRWNEVKRLIIQDKICNIHPKNRLFIFIFRAGGYFYNNQYVNFLYKILSSIFRLLIKIFFNRYNHYPLEIQVGGGLRLPHNMGIVLSGDAVIGEYCTIFHQVTIGIDGTSKSKNAPRLGDYVFVGAGAKIIGDISIGNHVTIGANAVVTQNIPDNCTVVGCNRILE